MNDKILEMFFDTERWRYAIEKGVNRPHYIVQQSISIRQSKKLVCSLIWNSPELSKMPIKVPAPSSL